MAKCTFCGETLTTGTGKMYVKKDGKVLYFDKSKCQKNMLNLNRKPREVRWTEEGRIAKKLILASIKTKKQ
ncbi:MAG: 50S ribosomal protein L24e [Nanoarchaeota archaeon]